MLVYTGASGSAKLNGVSVKIKDWKAGVKNKIKAESINSKMGEKDRKRVLADLSCKQPDTRFLYVTPEQVNELHFYDFTAI